jgi:glucosamine kinase
MSETKRVFLVIDAGGTSTRAVIVDSSGRCLGYGRAGGGNPTSTGITSAVAAVGLASEQARAGSDITGGPPHLVVIALAGENTAGFREQVSARLAHLGFGPVIVEPDLLGMFHSGTHHRDGYVLVAGTGAVAARVAGGELDHVVGGKGWLLGDAGSGYWIGHQVARAVVAALDDQGPATALTELVLKTVAITTQPDPPAGRAQALKQLVSILYSWRPVQLSEFAPLAFRVHEDPVAREILVAASAALAELLVAVRAPNLAGPVIAGGSVLIRGFLAAPPGLRERLVLPTNNARVIPVADGVVGAAVLALRSVEIDVDETLWHTIQMEVARVARLRQAGRAGRGR